MLEGECGVMAAGAFFFRWEQAERDSKSGSQHRSDLFRVDVCQV
jgi:hypothetical protein